MTPSLPRVDSLSDEDLYRGFESAHLPANAFRHRVHLRAAFLYLSRYEDFGEAATRFRRALKRFAARHGVAHRYHETLTWAYLSLVSERMQQGRARTSRAFLRRHPELSDPRNGLLARYYDVGAITRSTLARRVFVLPKPNRTRRAR